MTKVSDDFLNDVVNDHYIVESGDELFSNLRNMAEELQDARKTLKRLKRVSVLKSYTQHEQDMSRGLASEHAEFTTIQSVLNNIGLEYVTTEKTANDDIFTVIASVYVLEKE